MSKRVGIAGMLIAVMVISLLGCTLTRSDAPSGLMNLMDSWGVAIHSAKSPYRITSYSRIHRENPTRRRWNRRDMLKHAQLIAQECEKNWCWSIRAVPIVALAWKNWKKAMKQHNCHELSTGTCAKLGWNAAFRRLYTTVTKLLGHEPLLARVQLFLLPAGNGYRSAVSMRSISSVPLEFGFTFPVDIKMPGFHKQAESALIHAVVTTAYEFQHIEYADGKTAGPTIPLAAKTATKDEANSECWKLSAEVALTRGSLRSISFPRETEFAMQINKAEAGGKPSFSNAAITGPTLLYRYLGNYLLHRYPGIKGNIKIRISSKDLGARRALFAYCMAFSRYKGNILQHPMPTTDMY